MEQLKPFKPCVQTHAHTHVLTRTRTHTHLNSHANSPLRSSMLCILLFKTPKPPMSADFTKNLLVELSHICKPFQLLLLSRAGLSTRTGLSIQPPPTAANPLCWSLPGQNNLRRRFNSKSGSIFFLLTVALFIREVSFLWNDQLGRQILSAFSPSWSN